VDILLAVAVVEKAVHQVVVQGLVEKAVVVAVILSQLVLLERLEPQTQVAVVVVVVARLVVLTQLVILAVQVLLSFDTQSK
jgi:hypothetical protein